MSNARSYARRRTLDFAARILSSLDGSISWGSSVLVVSDPMRYLELEVNPRTYQDVDHFRDDYFAVELMSKYDNFDLTIDREAVALEKFFHAEDQCAEAANRLRKLARGQVSITSPLSWILHSSRVKIASLLRSFDWDEAARYFSFGPGASIGTPRNRSSGHHKYGHLSPSVTQACSALAAACISRNREWYNHLCPLGQDPLEKLSFSRGNRVTTVPKNAKTDRVIAIEPMMNMYVQKGIGGVIRSRLRKIGIDLNDQGVNQALAREGSLTGTLATVDLSSASDCISLRLVEDLLPTDWFSAIEASRSPVGVLPSGEEIFYRKVSSMGNGYTFELESLIFWAITSSVVDFLQLQDRRVGVYGDDIVVHVDAVPLLAETLSFVGFTFNRKKSFWEGHFRESCGKHYFNGIDVTPFYIRKDVDSDERLIWLANTIRQQAWRMLGSSWGCDARLEEAWHDVVKAISRNVRKTLSLIHI